MIKVAVSGAKGLIGARLTELWQDKFKVIPLDRTEFDIIDKKAVKDYLEKVEFDVFLHLAAYTNVDGAEKDKELAYKINVEGTKNLFNTVQQKNKKFIYISTDFVFDGKKENIPFTEKSLPNPLGWYGKTKYEGEKIVAGKAAIVRLSYPFGPSPALKQCFIHRIIGALKAKKTLKMITDSLITPTPIDNIGAGLARLIDNYRPQIFHLVGRESISPYNLGLKIARDNHLNKDLVQPITFAQYSQERAPRPQWAKIISLNQI
ncbi:MAG: SDR family oxidoreductase [FCB group bacterium]|nr:SDR family oxidoreductase [FCB group bacterium]